MTLKQAFFILRHGSAEGNHKYLEAIKVIEDEYNRQKAEIERLDGLVKELGDYNMTYNELKPCPLCGGEVYLEFNECGTFVVRCKKCPLDFGRFWFSRKQDIKKSWNTRTKERGDTE